MVRPVKALVPPGNPMFERSIWARSRFVEVISELIPWTNSF
jgi:hypothetical protein